MVYFKQARARVAVWRRTPHRRRPVAPRQWSHMAVGRRRDETIFSERLPVDARDDRKGRTILVCAADQLSSTSAATS